MEWLEDDEMCQRIYRVTLDETWQQWVGRAGGEGAISPDWMAAPLPPSVPHLRRLVLVVASLLITIVPIIVTWVTKRGEKDFTKKGRRSPHLTSPHITSLMESLFLRAAAPPLARP